MPTETEWVSVQTRKGKLIAALIFSLLMGLQTSFEFPSFYRSLHTHTHRYIPVSTHAFSLVPSEKVFPPNFICLISLPLLLVVENLRAQVTTFYSCN